eukprot:62453-Prymnesium_polylepis.1
MKISCAKTARTQQGGAAAWDLGYPAGAWTAGACAGVRPARKAARTSRLYGSSSVGHSRPDGRRCCHSASIELDAGMCPSAASD